MKTVKVGIIGAGGISECHTKGYQNLDNVEVVAVCDIDLEKAKVYAKEHNIPNVYSNYEELLELEGLDAVSVTTWNNGHAHISIAALEAGKHVLCEKPLAMSVEESKLMIEAEKKSGKLLMIGFVRRFETGANYIKDLIEAGELGHIYYAKTGYIRRWGAPGGWFSDMELSGGGPMIDIGVHVIDLIRYMTGKPKAVSVTAATFDGLGIMPEIKGVDKYVSTSYDPENAFHDVEDSGVAMIRFDNGLIIHVEASWVMHTKEDTKYLQLFGDKAGVNMEPELEFYKVKNNYLIDEKPVIEIKNEFDDIFGCETAHFIDCIVNNTPCQNPSEDGLEIMRIIEAIYESSRTKREVVIKR